MILYQNMTHKQTNSVFKAIDEKKEPSNFSETLKQGENRMFHIKKSIYLINTNFW